jgi:hypothetical protein
MVDHNAMQAATRACYRKRTHSKQPALDSLAKHLGIFRENVAESAENARTWEPS